MPSIANTVLRAWDLAQDAPAWQRPAALLSAFSGVPLTEALRLGVARRDAALLAWRAALFGSKWAAFAQCPGCAAMLEYELPIGSEALTDPGDEFEVEAEGRRWLVRWPDSEDLAVAAACADRSAARSLLWSRILPGEAEPACSAAILAAVAEAHRGCRRLDLHCCACPRTWSVVFDAGEFLWREVRAAAHRILREVDSIARVYHWSEREILALSEARRRGYLEMVQ
jgi:hypothetical protein